jgi:cytochrome P450 family 2 subfamily K
MADKLHLPYTAATLLEVQRCGNIVPINLQHATKHDVTIAGRHIPAGSRESHAQ